MIFIDLKTNLRHMKSRKKADLHELLSHICWKLHYVAYIVRKTGSHITLQPKTGYPLKLSRVEPGQYLDGRPPEKN